MLTVSHLQLSEIREYLLLGQSRQSCSRSSDRILRSEFTKLACMLHCEHTIDHLHDRRTVDRQVQVCTSAFLSMQGMLTTRQCCCVSIQARQAVQLSCDLHMQALCRFRRGLASHGVAHFVKRCQPALLQHKSCLAVWDNLLRAHSRPQAHRVRSSVTHSHMHAIKYFSTARTSARRPV